MSLFTLFFVISGLATGWSPVQGILPILNFRILNGNRPESLTCQGRKNISEVKSQWLPQAAKRLSWRFRNYLVLNSADTLIVMQGILHNDPHFHTAIDRLIFLISPDHFILFLSSFGIYLAIEIHTVDTYLVENCRLLCVDLLFAILGSTELNVKVK
jgi:hypothetical protein